MPALYVDHLRGFVGNDAEQLLGRLTRRLAEEGFPSTTDNTFSWVQEIAELQAAFRHVIELLPQSANWRILLEYVLPVVGQRVDCILLANEIIFVIEYKGGSSSSARSALRQAQDYALNLADFHEASRNRTIVPIAVGTFRTPIPFQLSSPLQGAATAAAGLPLVIVRSFSDSGGVSTILDHEVWEHSRYFPVPGIIQAASAIFQNHDVKDLAHSRAGAENLEVTQKAVTSAVLDARQRGVKKLVVITGVPGAGKTLAGLNAVQRVIQELNLESEQAAFLSGNGPLVAVLQEALKRSMASGNKRAGRAVRARVREIHRFGRDTYRDNRPPADRLIVFDEAQRAWTATRNKKKFGLNISEPELLLEIMGRHAGWAVIVALVGGGQEIHGGEAGLAAWGDAIANNIAWEVVTSPEAVLGGPSVAGSRLFRGEYPEGGNITCVPALHLRVSKRSYETDVTAGWVNAVLDGRQEAAVALANGGDLPIYLTRDLATARSWLRSSTQGHRRAGLVASSGAVRLRADGVEAPTFDFLGGIDYVRWFLEPAGDYRSSNQLEVALSEFELQGLELDYVGLLWGGDLVFPNAHVTARKIRGTEWCRVSGIGDPQASADDPRTRIQNKYRVLLTRFRKAMVIFVPKGSPDDPTRDVADFDGVADYLIGCGVRSI